MQLDWLIIGLGNPGQQYAGSLHNAGFDVLDMLLCELQADPAFLTRPEWAGTKGIKATKGAQFHAALLRRPVAPSQSLCSVDGNALLVKPQTFMNLSGKIWPGLRKRYEFAPERCIVVLDNLDMEPGRLRLKFGASSSSHNGLRSLCIPGLPAPFWRLFVGIGHPGSPEAVSHYVLNKPRKSDAEIYMRALRRAQQALRDILFGAAPESVAGDLNRRHIEI